MTKPLRLVAPLACLLWLLQACTTRTEPFRDEKARLLPNSIATLESANLGGSRQWLLIRGANRANPILLFLHGGPGSPYSGLAHVFQGALEEHFVVVHWDQRGSGKSFPGTTKASMTVERLQADTHELVLLLRQRFAREKIFLLGHSWGAYLGLTEAKNHPENQYAYIGAGQMIDLVKQEQMSHDFVAGQAKAEANDKALAQLAEIGYPPYQKAAAAMETKYTWLWKYGGMIEGETGPFPFVKALLRSKEYSLADIYRFVRGMSFSLQALAHNESEAFWRLKAPAPDSDYRVPLFFITGEQDRVTPAILIENYLTEARAPIKKSYVIANAGHFAFFTDPQRFSAIVIAIRDRTYPQADRSATLE